MLSRYSSDRTLLLDFPPEDRQHIPYLACSIHYAAIEGVIDLHPAYASILIEYDPLIIDMAALSARLASVIKSLPPPIDDGALIEIPVRYGGDNGPDLAQLAKGCGLTEWEVIQLHAQPLYTVAFLGFSPGFGYLTGLPEELATPRLAVPRKSVPAGSVGIAGFQTGIYPLSTPGGWNLIGRTSLTMFDPNRDPMSLLSIGDQVRFIPE